MGIWKKCVDIGDLGGFDVRMQFVQGICILHGQNKAKNEIFDGQIPEQRPGTHRSRVWKMVFEMGF